MNIKKFDGMFVAIDNLNNIIGFDMDIGTVKEYAEFYNETYFLEKKRVIRIVDPESRLAIKKLL